MLKVCSKCKQEKPLEEFRKRGKNNKLRSECKECERKYWQEYKKSPDRFFSKLTANINRKGNRRISVAEVKKIGYPEGQPCYICGQIIENREDAEIDHIVPNYKRR